MVCSKCRRKMWIWDKKKVNGIIFCPRCYQEIIVDEEQQRYLEELGQQRYLEELEKQKKLEVKP